MGKKFMGLGGTDHFWDRAKAWILNQITSAVAAKIAEVVADAPEDLDTLKEIADWIKNHANDAAAMNTQITENKSNIATNTSDISALKTSVAGKADKVHTHSAGDITSGTLPIANGGTGATDAKNGFVSLANGLTQGQNPQDKEYMIYKSGGNWGLYTLFQFWEYIKGKISSVLGLTKDNYGGKASTAGTADKAVDVVDYGDTSGTVKVGYYGTGVTADKLLQLAGYTEREGNSVKLKDVSKEELIKWLGIPRIKYADYQTPAQAFTQFQQVPIELSNFSSEVTPNNVLCLMVIYWTGVQLIASADWGSSASSGLKCALIALQAGTGYAIIRCVYMV